MLQVVRRHNAGNVQTASRAFSDFVKAWSAFRRKEQKMSSALLMLAAANLFLVSGAVSFFLLARK